jgi:hypothetical protein
MVMPKGNPKPKPRQPKKSYQVKSVRLAEHLCPIAENSLKGTTSTIELGLELISFLANEANCGNERAISLLAKFGVEAKATDVEPIIVYRADGEVAAWIV